MKIQIAHVPFARYGSFMTFSMLPPEWGHKGLVLRTMHRGVHHEVFKLEIVRDGEVVDYDVEVTPTLATLTPKDGGAGKVEVCLPETDVARVRVTGGVNFRMTSYAIGKNIYGFPVGDGVINLNMAANKIQYRMFPHSGSLDIDLPVHIGDHQRGAKNQKKKPEHPIIADWSPDAEGTIEFTLYEFVMSPRDLCTLDSTFDECHALAEKDWQDWADKTVDLPEKYREGGLHASHVNYASTVGAWGFLKKPTTLMSRNWMTSCWSWDHCFNAIACSYKNPEVGWNQLQVHFHLQEPGGCLPDGVNAEVCGWNYCKPPIHGWALSRMIKANPALFGVDRMREFYPKLVAWTNWWFSNRDSDGDGLPEYHHGNDSGWDNSTVFDVGFPFCGVDLQGFLILQMDMLSLMAERIGKRFEARQWKDRADSHLDLMLEKLWDAEAGQFRGFRALSGEREQVGNSLLDHMVMVLGDRLPREYGDKVVKFLEPDGKFITKYGPATEAVDSPKYLKSGYWRGPIWGSETVLLVDGLARGGYTELAGEIARRYCDMCLESMLFAENYDPLTGEPLCDKAYTWGSSAYLILAREFCD